MATKTRSVKSLLADFDKAFVEWRDAQAAKVPNGSQKDYKLGADYSREYATVMSRTPYFDLGFAEGRSFSQEWFRKNN